MRPIDADAQIKKIDGMIEKAEHPTTISVLRVIREFLEKAETIETKDKEE